MLQHTLQDFSALCLIWVPVPISAKFMPPVCFREQIRFMYCCTVPKVDAFDGHDWLPHKMPAELSPVHDNPPLLGVGFVQERLIF